MTRTRLRSALALILALVPASAGAQAIVRPAFASRPYLNIFQPEQTTNTQPALNTATTWNDGAVVFTAWKGTVTDTASAAGSKVFEFFGGAAGTTSLFSFDKNGTLAVSGSFSTGSAASANHYTTRTGGSSFGLATSAEKIVKSVTAIANAVATPVLTVTVPNAAHSAIVRVTIIAALGAGGAIGASEAAGAVSYDIAIARTPGVATVAVFSTAYGSAMANVVGGSTITVTAAASAVAGLVTDPQTFTVNVTITRATGTATNHTAVVMAEIVNAAAAGITIS